MEKISFSELKTWKECPYKHKLTYVEGNRLFQGNIYTAFGTAIHSVCEEIIVDNRKNSKEIFLASYERELENLPDDTRPTDQAIIDEFRTQGLGLCEHILPAVKEEFKEYEVVSVEEPLFEQINDFEASGRNFKGFIDLVLRTSDGKIHIIDWKSCSWGWNMKKKSDPMVNYQLTFYKKFFSEKHSIPPEDIETYFALLKRTARDKKVEIFRVTSGKKKTKNALNLLEIAIKNIDNKVYIKNRLSCERCVFYKTEYCK